MLWQVITVANIAISIAYFCISYIIFSGLRATKQLGNNKLGLALRDAWYWQTAAWDVLSPIVAFYYLSLRGSYASVLRGAQMFEDFKVRERQALGSGDLRRREAAGVNMSPGGP